MPGEHLVEHHAQGKHIGALVHRVARDLFRGHVAERTRHSSRHRQRGRGQRCLRSRVPGQAEVEELDPQLSQEHVRRFQVAVNQPRTVKCRDGVHERQQHVERLGHGHGAAQQSLRQQLAFEQFHDQERLSLVFTQLIQPARMRMLEGRGRARFSDEPFRGRGVVALVVEQLHRHATPELAIERLIHVAHTAATERTLDHVAAT